MKKILFFLLLLPAFACHKKLTRPEVEEYLKKTFIVSLYELVNNDSTKVRYHIEGVAFYEEADYYDCQFKVKMLLQNHDTTGIMKATVTKDFLKVVRKP